MNAVHKIIVFKENNWHYGGAHSKVTILKTDK